MMIIVNKVFPKMIGNPQEGYVIFRSLLSSYEVNLVTVELEKLIKTTRDGWLNENSVSDENGEYIVIKSLDTPSDFFFDLGRNSILMEVAESFAQKKVTPLYSEYFNKPPFFQHPSPPHQDHAFYNEHFDDELGLTFWIALDKCDSQNGCMHVLPFPDRKLFKHNRSEALGFGYELKDQYTNNYTPIALSPGDALLHGSFTPHYCPPNHTDQPRRALAISFRTSQYREELCWTQ